MPSFLMSDILFCLLATLSVILSCLLRMATNRASAKSSVNLLLSRECSAGKGGEEMRGKLQNHHLHLVILFLNFPSFPPSLSLSLFLTRNDNDDDCHVSKSRPFFLLSSTIYHIGTVETA